MSFGEIPTGNSSASRKLSGASSLSVRVKTERAPVGDRFRIENAGERR